MAKTYKFKSTFIIKSINDYIQAIKTIKQKENIDELWFRGQSDSNWSLIPNIMRKQEGIELPIRANLSGFPPIRENYVIPDFRQLPDRVRVLSKKNNYCSLKALDLLAFAQHHGLLTPLIDWSEDPLVALYFATESFEPDVLVDASIYVTNPYSINSLVNISAVPSTIEIDENLEKEIFKETKFKWFCFKSNKQGFRICRQSGNFIFQNTNCPLLDDDEESKSCIYQLKIPHSNIKEHKNILDTLNITKKALYGSEEAIDEECKYYKNLQKEDLEKLFAKTVFTTT